MLSASSFFYLKGELNMIKKNITYTDYNGVTRTEPFYFNLSKSELMEMEFGTVGGFTEMVQKVVATQDLPSLIKIFKDFVLKSYGIKSDDGRRFEKSAELATAFSQTEAYTTLFMELATDSKAAAEFINGVVPAEVAKEMSVQNVTSAT